MIIKIAQISDIHIGPLDELYLGIDVRKNFLRTLDEIIKSSADFIIISGDLAYDMGESGSYTWIKGVMDKINIPYRIMAGNHDNVSAMARVFDIAKYIKNSMLYYEDTLGGYPVLFLDSEPDLIHKDQLEWLLETDKNLKSKALLFIHHPPCLCGHQFMDRKYSLRNIEELQSCLKKMNNIEAVFCGHYHFEKSVWLGELPIFVCPATQMQISPDSEEFKISDNSPGWRMITWDGKTLNTSTHYVDLNQNFSN
jgi:3',5'-cyclic-AMP phosphodiesterase